MAYNSHFAKGKYKVSDKNSEFMQGVYSDSTRIIQAVLNEFEYQRELRGISQAAAVKSIRDSGGLISRQNLSNYRSGKFYVASTTYLNILSRWCGYSGLFDLLTTVHSRDKAAVKGC